MVCCPVQRRDVGGGESLGGGPRRRQLRVARKEDPVHLRREVKEHLVDTSLLNALRRGEGLPNEGEDAPRLEAVGVQRDLVGRDVGGRVRAVGPGRGALAPGGDVLGHEGGAELQGVGYGCVAGYAAVTGGVVYCDEALPGVVLVSL